MAHAAKIENGVVTQVIVVPDGLGGDENDTAVNEYINGIGLGGEWVRTSYNASIRGKYAGIGDTYDPVLDEFVSPVVEPPAVPE
jgi:hypothetical protein